MKLFSVLLPPSIAIVLLLCIVLVFILCAQLLLYLHAFTEDLSFFIMYHLTINTVHVLLRSWYSPLLAFLHLVAGGC